MLDKPCPSFSELRKEEGSTTVSFTVPCQLVDDGDYEITMEGHTGVVKILGKPTTDEHFEQVTGWTKHVSEGGKISLTGGDRRGVCQVTGVSVFFPFRTHPDYNLLVVLAYVNRLLDVWRFKTGAYFIKEGISDRDIVAWEWVVTDGEGKKVSDRVEFLVSGRIKFPVSPTSESVPREAILEELKKGDPPPLWNLIWLNAFLHFSERKFDLTVVQCNVAVEDFA